MWSVWWTAVSVVDCGQCDGLSVDMCVNCG